MFSAIYFAVASTLLSLHAPEITASQILGGRWLEAANALGRRADADAGVKADAADVQLLGDIQLMTGRLEDAEASYRCCRARVTNCASCRAATPAGRRCFASSSAWR
jgi:hypothetical protein